MHRRFRALVLLPVQAGPAPSDQLMYKPVRIYPVVDPFGVDIMIFAAL